MTIQQVKNYLEKHSFLTFRYNSKYYSLERSNSLFGSKYSLIATDTLPQQRNSLEKLGEQVYIDEGVPLIEAITHIDIPEINDPSWETYEAVRHSAIVCGNEIHFFFRRKSYWIAYASDGRVHLSDDAGNIQWFNSCHELFENASIYGKTLEGIWAEVVVDAC